MPGLLGLLDVDEVSALDDEQPDPPLRPEVRESVLAKVRWRRRRTRWVNSAVIGLAAAVLAVGVLLVARPQIIGLRTEPTIANTAQMVEMTKMSPTPINASIAVTDFSWGTRIDMACSYGQWGRRDAPPQNLGMVVLGRDGSRSQVATWLGSPRGHGTAQRRHADASGRDRRSGTGFPAGQHGAAGTAALMR